VSGYTRAPTGTARTAADWYVTVQLAPSTRLRMACGWLTVIFKVGAIMIDVAPDIELPDHTGQTWQLGRALELGSVLVVFYRGDW
jgi:hypothetical protein